MHHVVEDAIKLKSPRQRGNTSDEDACSLAADEEERITSVQQIGGNSGCAVKTQTSLHAMMSYILKSVGLLMLQLIAKNNNP